MKKVLLLVLAVSFMSCEKEEELCNCTLLVYEKSEIIEKQDILIDCDEETGYPSLTEREDREYYIICD